MKLSISKFILIISTLSLFALIWISLFMPSLAEREAQLRVAYATFIFAALFSSIVVGINGDNNSKNDSKDDSKIEPTYLDRES